MGFPAGHHCSWCLSADFLRIKLKSALTGDGIRWGDFKEKYDLNYLQENRRTGRWFDGTFPAKLIRNGTNDPFYAPKFVLQNPHRYSLGLLDAQFPNDFSPRVNKT